MEKKYMKRIIDKEIDKYLESVGAIVLLGPKWCGKTTTAKQHAKSVLKLDDIDNREQYKKLAKLKPSKLLEGDKPRLIDEWQIAPILWDGVRNSVDENEEKGLFLLTGSTSVDESEIEHSGTGRIHRMIMYPMSLYESGESNGEISLIDLFNKKDLDIDGITSDLTVDDLFFAMCRGGWPETLKIKNKENQLLLAKTYIKNICESDMSTVDNVKKDPERAKILLKSYARNISGNAKDTTIMKDVKSHYENLSRGTYYSYINALKRLFVINNVYAWSINVRSAATNKATTKKEFIDPSIATAALDLTPDKLDKDLKTAGLIFETLCIRDLRIYTNSHGGSIYYFRKGDTLEVDSVVVLEDGRYGLIEIKLGSDEIDKGCKNLLKTKEIIEKTIEKDNKRFNKPSFLAVLTGGNIAYTREDGVKIIPIGCLKN